MLVVGCHNKILQTEGLHDMFTAVCATVANPQAPGDSPVSASCLALGPPGLLRCATVPDFVCSRDPYSGPCFYIENALPTNSLPAQKLVFLSQKF